MVDAQVDHAVEPFEELLDIVVGFDGQARQVDGGEAQIAASVGDLFFRVVDVGHHARAAAHVGDLCFRAALLVVFEVEGRVLEGEVGKQALRRAAHGQLEQVVVRLAGVVVDALLDAEDLDGEDGRLAVAQACLRAQKQVADGHARLRGGVHAVVDGRKGDLRAGAGVHGVEVVDQRLHGLIGGAVGLGNGLFVGERLQSLDVLRADAARAQKLRLGLPVGVVLFQRGVQPAGAQGIDDGAAVLLRVLHPQFQLQGANEVVAVALAEGLFHALGHGVVKVDDGLAAVLVVLVGLYGDAGQRRVGSDVVRLAQVAVAGGKAIFKQLDEVDLAAGGGQREEVHVVDVDIPVAVRLGVLGLEHEHEVELLGALGTVLEHRAHGGIAVDVGVFAFDVGIDGGLVGNVLVNAH